MFLQKQKLKPRGKPNYGISKGIKLFYQEKNRKHQDKKKSFKKEE
jgi:hypothetical protein